MIITIIIIIIIIIKNNNNNNNNPVVVGALGSVSKKLAGHLEQLGIKNRTRTMQKSALLGSAHILRKVLEVWGLGMRLDWIFLLRENPCAKFYIIIIIVILNGTFICLFDCRIVNLASYGQFTIGCLRLNYSKINNFIKYTYHFLII